MKIEKYLVIDPDGSVRWEEIPREKMLERLHEIIDCDCVENVHTILPWLNLIVDESGRIKNPPKPHNETASLFYLGYILGSDDIVGTVVLAGIDLVDGESDWVPLQPYHVDKLREMGFEVPDDD